MVSLSATLETEPVECCVAAVFVSPSCPEQILKYLLTKIFEYRHNSTITSENINFCWKQCKTCVVQSVLGHWHISHA